MEEIKAQSPEAALAEMEEIAAEMKRRSSTTFWFKGDKLTKNEHDALDWAVVHAEQNRGAARPKRKKATRG